MILGKLPPQVLEQYVLAHTGFPRADILVGPGIGEDAAVIDFGDEVCVIASDPVTGSFTGIGRLAVHIAANDVAATGAEPVGLQIVLLWPPEDDANARLSQVMAEMSETAAELGIAIVGGHTEITSRIDDGMVITTCVGGAPKDRYMPSSGGKPGDDVLIVRTAGLEGTGILAADHATALTALAEPVVERAQQFLDEISIVAPALAARDMGVSAMHDVTEGGVIGALWELAYASKVGVDVRRSAIPIREETRAICDELGIDPLTLLGSGALLLTAPDGDRVKADMHAAGYETATIGRLTEPGDPVRLLADDGTATIVPEAPADSLWTWLQAQKEK